MEIGTQIKKGILEGCILKLILKRETYGYQICEDLAEMGFAGVSEGTVYPILIRLEKKGYIRARLEKSPLGPRRKVFVLTKDGEEYLTAFAAEWGKIETITKNFFKEGVK